MPQFVTIRFDQFSINTTEIVRLAVDAIADLLSRGNYLPALTGSSSRCGERQGELLRQIGDLPHVFDLRKERVGSYLYRQFPDCCSNTLKA